jgi:hypothetical protein
VTGGTRGRDVPCRRFRRIGGCPGSVTRSRASPREVAASLSVFPTKAGRVSWVSPSLHVLRGADGAQGQPSRARRLVPRDPEVFPASPAATDRSRRRNAHGVAPSPGYDRRESPRTLRGGATGLERTRCLPRVSSPTAHIGRRIYVTTPGLPHPVRSAFRVPRPPDGSRRPDPPELVSSR